MNKNWLGFVFLVLLTTGLCVAQQDAANQPSAQQTDVGQPTDMNEQLFKGCVGGTKDNYTLTDDSGKQFRLHSDKDINEHVGNMVEIRGTMKRETDESRAAATGALPQIDVADIKSVSKGCSSEMQYQR